MLADTPWPVIVIWVAAILFARLAKQKQKKTPAPMPARVPARPPVRSSIRLVLEDHSALSQESEPEVVDYDDAAASLVASRRREVEASERGEATVAPRAEPSIASPSARPPLRPSAPLARYADGSLRGAIILGEVLGRPISDR